jgi:aryl-alcohol dehydrogenase-like predicted oxidoreductase
MTTSTASSAARTVFRIGYGALQLERLHDRRSDAVALLRRAQNVLLIPGTANAAHLEADIAAGEIALDAATLATLDVIESRSNEVPIG